MNTILIVLFLSIMDKNHYSQVQKYWKWSVNGEGPNGSIFLFWKEMLIMSRVCMCTNTFYPFNGYKITLVWKLPQLWNTIDLYRAWNLMWTNIRKDYVTTYIKELKRVLSLLYFKSALTKNIKINLNFKEKKIMRRFSLALKWSFLLN